MEESAGLTNLLERLRALIDHCRKSASHRLIAEQLEEWCERLKAEGAKLTAAELAQHEETVAELTRKLLDRMKIIDQ